MPVARTKEQKKQGLSLAQAREANKGKNDIEIRGGKGKEVSDVDYRQPTFVLSGQQFDPSGKKVGEEKRTASYTSKSTGKDVEVPYSPTVFSNTSIIEDTIPRLQAQTASLPTFGSTETTTTSTGGGSSDESIDFNEILGFSGPKKKKKKRDMAGLMEEDPYLDAQMQLLKQMQQTSDRAYRDSVANIESQFNQRQAEQEASNTQNLAGIKQALNLGGSSRYAPISSTGIVSAQEAEGIKALASLDTQERQLISEARAAQQNNDFQLLSKKLNLLETVRSEKATAMEALNGEMRGNAAAAARDNEIAGLVAQGVTDPIEMLQTLNSKGGDYTIAEISGALRGLNELGSGGGVGFKLDNKAVGQLLGSGWTSPDIQAMQKDLATGASVNDILAGVSDESMKVALKTALGVDETSTRNITPGVGAPDALTEQAIRTRLFPKAAAILNKGSLSDSDREVIDERIEYFRSNGLSEQQILDVFSGWSADVNSPYNDSFRDIILVNDKDGQGVSPALSRVGSLLASGNYKGAMKAVEQTAMLRAKELDPDGYMGDAPTEVYTKRIDRIKQFLANHTDYGNTGFIEGNFNKVLGKLKGSDSAKLKAEFTQLYQTFRKENAGSAVTDSEQRFLNQLFADVDDPRGNLIEKLDSFQRGIIDRHNATRNSVSLPPVRVLDVLEPAERLNLYGQSTSRSTDSNQANI